MSLFGNVLEYLYAPGGTDRPVPRSPIHEGKRRPAAVNSVLRFLQAQNLIPRNFESIDPSKFPNLKKAMRKHRSSLTFISENTNVKGPRKRLGDQKGAGIFVNFDKWNHYLDS